MTAFWIELLTFLAALKHSSQEKKWRSLRKDIEDLIKIKKYIESDRNMKINFAKDRFIKKRKQLTSSLGNHAYNEFVER